jgi:hypothetical protein
MDPNQHRLDRLFNRAQLTDQPNIPAPPSLSATVLASLQSPPPDPILQQTLNYGVALAASITLLLLLAPDAFPPLSLVSEPESIVNLFIDLSDL